MTPLVHPKLINDPFGDPGILIDFLQLKRVVLLDLGNIVAIGGVRGKSARAWRGAQLAFPDDQSAKTSN